MSGEIVHKRVGMLYSRCNWTAHLGRDHPIRWRAHLWRSCRILRCSILIPLTNVKRNFPDYLILETKSGAMLYIWSITYFSLYQMPRNDKKFWKLNGSKLMAVVAPPVPMPVEVVRSFDPTRSGWVVCPRYMHTHPHFHHREEVRIPPIGRSADWSFEPLNFDERHSI